MNESLSGCEHELVSTSLTVATLPLLVLTRGRSQSLTSEIPQGPWGKDRLSSHRSDSFDSLHFGRLSSVSPRLPSGVPRIIVISPTSESSLIKHDSACLEESMEALEDSVFASLNFSSEVFQAVELLSWPTSSDDLFTNVSDHWTTQRIQVTVTVAWTTEELNNCLHSNNKHALALACSVQHVRLQQGHGRPEGQHGLKHIFPRSLENDKRNNIFSRAGGSGLTGWFPSAAMWTLAWLM